MDGDGDGYSEDISEINHRWCKSWHAQRCTFNTNSVLAYLRVKMGDKLDIIPWFRPGPDHPPFNHREAYMHNTWECVIIVLGLRNYSLK